MHFTSAYFWTDPDVKLIIPSLVDLLEDFVEVLLRLTQQGKVWSPAVPPNWYPGTRAPGDA